MLNNKRQTRRDFLKTVSLGVLALNVPQVFADENENLLSVNPKPKFELSPYLYMQFMEPLGTTDGSVEAAWDFGRNCWRQDVIDVTKRLGPSLMRWGGCFSSYYRWKEAVGPRDKRTPMLNMCWGGIETNQIGTVEFVDFCRQVQAEPFMCVNFESDGRSYWHKDPKGSVRSGGADEAAEWVSYCNNPNDRLRNEHGIKEPVRIELWQLGNETSYDRNGFDCETAGKKTIEFAKAMRKQDPTIKLIGWGDSGWAPRILDMASEHLQYIAFHHMFNPDHGQADSPLRGTEYRKDPARTWEHLMNAHKTHNARINSVRQQVEGYSTPLALTECHFALPGRNRCEVLSTWAAGVANARLLNVNERHGDKLKIATLADFCGTRWQVNAVMIPVPGGESFMMPVAMVMSLYRHHTGEQAVDIDKVPDDLDVTASRTGDKIFLHVVNTNRIRSVKAQLNVKGMEIISGEVFEMAADPEFEVLDAAGQIKSVQKQIQVNTLWEFPAASVSAVELSLRKTV